MLEVTHSIAATNTKQAVIAAGVAVSNEIDLEGYQMAGIEMPSDWDTANLTFQAASMSGGNYRDLYNDGGNEVLLVAAAGRFVSVSSAALSLAPLRFIKIRSGSTGTPVNQSAQRTLTLSLKR
ncbi:MAG: hypothetical protein P4N41_18080 [Negativicutes bacterium]|nr:hypothetical protein [Negativicutes bacterium]